MPDQPLKRIWRVRDLIETLQDLPPQWRDARVVARKRHGEIVLVCYPPLWGAGKFGSKKHWGTDPYQVIAMFAGATPEVKTRLDFQPKTRSNTPHTGKGEKATPT